jgi:hypothetical protein
MLGNESWRVSRSLHQRRPSRLLDTLPQRGPPSPLDACVIRILVETNVKPAERRRTLALEHCGTCIAGG